MSRRDAPLLFSAQRALETVQALEGPTPVRLFSVLFPLWEVEVGGMQRRSVPYELLEQFVARGITQGGLHSAAELAQFFGLEHALVDKALSFLQQVGHVEGADGALALTRLGRDSLADGVSYQELETRRKLYFEAFGLRPLPADHYRLHFLAAAEARDNQDRRFFRGFSFEPWRPEVLRALVGRGDRAEWNLPAEVRDVREQAVARAYVPMHIVETRERVTDAHYGARYVVLTRVRDLRDLFFEEVVNSEPDLLDPLYAQAEPEVRRLMQEELRGRGVADRHVRFRQLAPDAWRATVTADALRTAGSRLTLADVGTYLLVRGYCLQVWCDDPAVRHEAALDQAVAVIGRWQRQAAQWEVDELLETVARRLHIRQLTQPDLRAWASKQGAQRVLTRLDELEA